MNKFQFVGQYQDNEQLKGNADKIGVAFSKFNTFCVLCCSNQAEKMLKYIEDFSKKAKTQTKL